MFLKWLIAMILSAFSGVHEGAKLIKDFASHDRQCRFAPDSIENLKIAISYDMKNNKKFPSKARLVVSLLTRLYLNFVLLRVSINKRPTHMKS
jgi:hypothetical protein